MTGTAIFWSYSYLQVLDLLTTVAFLLLGIREGNPIVRLALNLSPSPWYGLTLVKVAAIGLGLYCFRLGKTRLLQRINIMFAAVVTWNLIALIVGAAHSGKN